MEEKKGNDQLRESGVGVGRRMMAFQGNERKSNYDWIEYCLEMQSERE